MGWHWSLLLTSHQERLAEFLGINIDPKVIRKGLKIAEGMRNSIPWVARRSPYGRSNPGFTPSRSVSIKAL
jgi:hypothetical protein